jgi:hypothetical protein
MEVSINPAVRSRIILMNSHTNFAMLKGMEVRGNRKTNRVGGFHDMMVTSRVE